VQWAVWGPLATRVNKALQGSPGRWVKWGLQGHKDLMDPMGRLAILVLQGQLVSLDRLEPLDQQDPLVL
jgi:hypothetical protein